MRKKKNILKKIIIGLFISFFLFSINLEKTYPNKKQFIRFETAKNYFKKGYIFFNRMQYLSAVEFFRKAITVYPEYFTAREYLARSYKSAGFLDEAIKEWEILSTMTSDNLSIVNKLDSLRYRESEDIQETITVGDNEFVLSEIYEPSNLGRYRFTNPIDIAIDKEKNIYITSFSSGKLIKLDSNGDGASVFDLGVGTRFYGVDTKKNKVCVSDFKGDIIYLLDKELDIIKSFGSPGMNPGEFHGPEGVVINDAGYIYVVDSGNHRVQKFDEEGNFILKFGNHGEYEGQLNKPSYLLIKDNIVYVTDSGNKRIVCFDESGNFLKNIIIDGLIFPGGINQYQNDLIISDERNGLLFYSEDNKKSFWFNSWGKDNKRFTKLLSAAVDRDGILYCLDYKKESLFVFTPLQASYTNFDIEVTSIDLNTYPIVAFYLNVRNRNGSPVYNLKRSNFSIIEDSSKVTGIYVDYLKQMNPSISAVLCVDRSKNTMGYHNEIPWISDFILKKMKKNDSIKVLNFNNDIWIGNDFDWSRRRTLRALRKRDYNNGKCIGKVLYNAINDLLPKLTRRGIVLVSDGGVGKDSFDKYTPRNIIEYAKCHYIPINFIVFKKKDPILVKIARETGGQILKANELNGLRKVYDSIKESEEYRYVVVYSTYRTPTIKGWWSDVRIKVDYKGQSGTEWGGYFVP